MDTVADIDSLLWHFARPLPVDRRDEFCQAAQAVLARLECPGPGLVHWTLAELLSSYFIPPIADCDRHNGARKHRRFSKLASGAPLA